jgi:SnoaL-like domain
MTNDPVLEVLRTRLDVLESQDAIRRLKARYMRWCDEQRGRAIADLFWDDGVWEGRGGSAYGVVAGHEAIAEMFERSPQRLTFTMHYLTNEAITVDGDHAVGRWNFLEPCTLRNETALWQGGTYRDEFERRGGEWRFRRLVLELRLRAPHDAGWVKQPIWDLPG